MGVTKGRPYVRKLRGVPVVSVLLVASGLVCLSLLEVRSRTADLEADMGMDMGMDMDMDAGLDSSPMKAATVSESFVNLDVVSSHSDVVSSHSDVVIGSAERREYQYDNESSNYDNESSNIITMQNNNDDDDDDDDDNNNNNKKCKWETGPEGEEDNRYPGFCEGLKTIKTAKSRSSAGCKAECCASEECNGWQYRGDLGCRHATRKHHGWCEPTAPSPWTGRELLVRDDDAADAASASGENCSWKKKEKRSQCKGLGPRRPKGGPYWTTPEECARDCCAHSECRIWQFREDKGCFWGKASYCDTEDGMYAWEPFKGGKKLAAS
eukprot:CAMPEP_0197543136 /NCGR_PEP_ID=MMETSP1318-20131121/68078_1 /TAXON_ID=552666 /ORGANISM="Partenskyella glossopodia, Strain RCC365" /LENGTH=323 /DNA_ID=CAMNT_0043102449 /DNA_START=156 /DNA_END=1127 /DNA_ORIENTATION=+